MKNITLTILFALLFVNIQAQITINYDPQKSIDSLITNLDKSNLTSDILYNRVTSFAKLTSFNGTDKNISNCKHFEQAFSELHRASKNEKFTTVKTLRDKYSFDKNQVEIGVINVGFYSLNYNNDNESENGISYDSIAKKLNPIAGKASFITHSKLIIAALKTTARGETITFNFKNSLIFNENPAKTIKHLTTDLGTANDYNIITNGILVNTIIPVSYSSSGIKVLSFTATFSDNTTFTTDTSIVIVTDPPEPGLQHINEADNVIPFPGYGETTPISGEIEYRIFYHDESAGLQKPILFIDGFDPMDTRKIIDADSNLLPNKHTSIKELMVYSTVANGSDEIDMFQAFIDEGYDVVIVNHPIYQTMVGGVLTTIDGGADYIERNAMAHVRLYQKLNETLATNGSDEELVIIGPSMGGQVSRYALAYMEKEFAATGLPEWNHNCRLWVSIDSPHQGANIPIGAQASLFFLGYTNGDQEAIDKYEKKILSKAGRQQLKLQFSHTYPNTINIFGRIFPSGYNSSPPSFHIQYYNNLQNNGLSGSNGFPQNLRKIAITNGSLHNNNGYSGQEVLNIKAYKTIFWKDRRVFHNKINFIKNQSQTNTIFHGEGTERDGLNIEWFSWTANFTNPLSQGSLDAVLGGTYNTQEQIEEQIVKKLEEYIEDEIIDSFNIITSFPRHTFMPTHSTLATSGFSNWYHPIDRNLVCSAQTPFDNYFGEPENTGHVTFTLASKEWLFEELAGNDPSVPLYTISAEIIGDPSICFNETKTYYLDSNCVGEATWLVANDIIILSQTGTSISIKCIESNGGFPYIRATFNNNQHIEKTLVSGTPVATPRAGADPIFCANGMELYNDDDYQFPSSPGADTYAIVSDDPQLSIINLNSDNTIPPHAMLDATVYGNYSMTLTTSNSCGSSSIVIPVEVAHCFTEDDWNYAEPYPNASDTSFAIDFTDQPNGSQFNIYLYDQYQNIKYSGQATNIEKIIETLNLQNGVYFLHVYESSNLKIRQIVVNH